jgi:hypothetical protein
MDISTSGKQDAPETPNGSTSPSPSEGNDVPHENTEEPVIMACWKHPTDPGRYLCTQVLKPGAAKAVSSLPTPPVDTPSQTSEARGSPTPDSDGVEVWSRNNGETMRVKRVEHEGSVLFLPIAATPQPQPVDPQSPPVKTTKQDTAVGRTQMPRSGSGSKASCKLPGMRSSTRVKQNDQISGGP